MKNFVQLVIDKLVEESVLPIRSRRRRVIRKPRQRVDGVFYRDNLRLMHDPTE